MRHAAWSGHRQYRVSGDVVGQIYHWKVDDGGLVRKFDASEMFFDIGDIAPFGGIINLTFTNSSTSATQSTAGFVTCPQSVAAYAPRPYSELCRATSE